MSNQGLEVIDQTVHLTHEWINELAERVGYSSKRSALRLLRTVLQILRDRVPQDEMAQFSAQLPLLVRGVMFEGWQPKLVPKTALVFQKHVITEMQDTSEFRGPEDTKYVFDLLNARISRGEVEDMRACLPQDIRAYWTAP
ncbi:DUF2267 domain-containing protein [uncultured Tateyamaria sp.]|uniref:DUF2267 domain-containing protein n=1 Tax=uncultured Tateyamaria sp. TaxID=455651 RepID=UPI0026278429|nr:DUF2267 domain-containing protein [uncultured Tateyamaria sp.]